MNRDLPTSVPTSDNAVVGASGALAAIAQAHALTDTDRERLESSYKSVGEFLAEQDFFGPLAVEVHAQGSMAIGTTTKPEGKAEFDVDLVARLMPTAVRHDAGYLLDQLDDAMREYAEQHGLSVKAKRRCTQLQYANAMHTDVTPVIDWPSHVEAYGDVAGLVPDRERCEHLGTNPRGYVRFFNDVASRVPRFATVEVRELAAKADVMPLPGPSAWRKPLAQFVQLFKIHRNIKFASHPELAPTSTFLTTQIALAYDALVRPGVMFQSPVHLLLGIWKKMPDYMTVYLRNGREHWVLPNPTHSKENLADRMNSNERQDAYRDWRQKFMRDVVALSEMYLPSGMGVKAITNSVESNFGSRSSKALIDSYSAAATRERAASQARILFPIAAATAPTVTVASRNHTFFGDM